MLNAASLTAAMKAACAIIERRNTIPVMSNVLLEATGDMLRIRSTNLDVEVTLDLDAADVGTFSTTVPAATLLAFVKTADKGAEVAFRFDDHDPRVEVIAGRAKMRFPVLPAGDFPLFSDKADGAARAMVSAAELGATMKAAEPYMSKSEALYAICGVNLTPDANGGIMATATDGSRLFQRSVTGSALDGELESAIIPACTVKWLTKFAPKAGDGWVEVDDRWACFDFPGVRVVSKLIDGVFPVYVCPEREAVARVTMRDLSDAIDLIATVAGNEKNRPFRLQLSRGELILTAGSPYTGQGETVIDSNGPFQAGFVMNFYATPLLSSLKAFAKGELLVIEHGGDDVPLVIRSDDRPDTEIVISPIRKVPVEQPLERPIVTFQSPDSTGLQHYYRVQVQTFASRPYAEWRTYAFPSAAAANRAYRRHVADARLRCQVNADPLAVVVWDSSMPAPYKRFITEIPAAGYMPFPPWYEAEASRRIQQIYSATGVFSDGFDSDVPWTRAVFDHALCSELATTPQITANRGRTKAHRVVGERRLKQVATAPVVALVEVAPVAAQLEVEPVPAGFTELTVDYLLDMDARAARLAEAVAVFGSVNDNDIPWTRKVLGLKLADAVEATPYLTVTTGRNGPIRALGATALAQSFRKAA